MQIKIRNTARVGASSNETLYSSLTNGGANPSGIYGPGTEFRDGVKGSIAGGYAAGPGSDQVTGIGTVMNGNII